jgi:hypothetical protein
MSREKEPPMVLDLSDVSVKRRLMEKINLLSGLYEVTIKPRRFQRSLNQNAYYWAAFVTPFTEWLQHEWGDKGITKEQAHIELKRAVLGIREKVNERTGEVMELLPTTHDLDTEQFSIYLDGAAKFLAEFAGIVVLPSEVFYQQKVA